MIAYLDSSVLLRVVMGQRKRLKEWKAIRSGVASVLARVECLRTLDRLRLSHEIGIEELASRREAMFMLMDEIDLIEPAGAVLDRAAQPLPTPLGTPDAIHLATALLWREQEATDLVMATHDAALGTAARACGLRVVGL